MFGTSRLNETKDISVNLEVDELHYKIFYGDSEIHRGQLATLLGAVREYINIERISPSLLKLFKDELTKLQQEIKEQELTKLIMKKDN